jgi:hypothetical protein
MTIYVNPYLDTNPPLNGTPACTSYQQPKGMFRCDGTASASYGGTVKWVLNFSYDSPERVVLVTGNGPTSDANATNCDAEASVCSLQRQAAEAAGLVIDPAAGTVTPQSAGAENGIPPCAADGTCQPTNGVVPSPSSP